MPCRPRRASVNRRMFGVDDPVTMIDRAGVVLSFGDDFSARGNRRSPPRANMRVPPGARRACWCRSSQDTLTEPTPIAGSSSFGDGGRVRLGRRGNLQRKEAAGSVSRRWRGHRALHQAEVSRITEFAATNTANRLALWELRRPGAGRALPTGHAHGRRTWPSGCSTSSPEHGKTVMRAAELPFRIGPDAGSFKALRDLNEAWRGTCARSMHGSSVYSAPLMGFADNLQKVPSGGWVRIGRNACSAIWCCVLSSLEDLAHVASSVGGTEFHSAAVDGSCTRDARFGDVVPTAAQVSRRKVLSDSTPT